MSGKFLTAAVVAGSAFAWMPLAHAMPLLTVTATDSNCGVCSIVWAPPDSTATPGTLVSTATGDTNFSTMTLTASGVPNVPSPDLTSVTLDITAATGAKLPTTLTITVNQTGLTFPAGATGSILETANNLINAPGPHTFNLFVNGLAPANIIDTEMIASHGTIGPQNVAGLLPAITSDGEQFIITFQSAQQSANDTFQFQASIAPEPTSLTILGSALVGLGWFARRRRKAA